MSSINFINNDIFTTIINTITCYEPTTIMNMNSSMESVEISNSSSSSNSNNNSNNTNDIPNISSSASTNYKPFTAFCIEVKNNKLIYRIYKRYTSFLNLYNLLTLRLGKPIILTMPTLLPINIIPREKDKENNDFLLELKNGLQIWLRKLLRDTDVMNGNELFNFLKDSDIYTDLIDISNDKSKLNTPREKSEYYDSNASNVLSKLSPMIDSDERIDHIARIKNNLEAAGTIEEEALETKDAPVFTDSLGIETNNTVKLEDFLLMKVVGKGSFGKVLQVKRIETGEIFAMKILKKESIVKRNQVEHTKTERNVLEFIRHPFIVQLHFAFQTTSKLYFVLDYCSGGELFFHLSKLGKFSEDLSRFYAAEMVCALEYLHNLGIVYRDLKPENVLLDAEGHIALTDFGLSKEGIIDNSSAHSFCGTPEYLAPEILNKSGHGRAADWWSLGALLYEMLTGMPPFYSSDRDRLFQKILKADLNFPKHVSFEAKSLLKGLLNRDPATRIGSSKQDGSELRSHPFFACIDWQALERKITIPSFKPLKKVSKAEEDTSNFDVEFTNLAVKSIDNDADGEIKSFLDDKFNGFTYVNQNSILKP